LSFVRRSLKSSRSTQKRRRASARTSSTCRQRFNFCSVHQ